MNTARYPRQSRLSCNGFCAPSSLKRATSPAAGNVFDVKMSDCRNLMFPVDFSTQSDTFHHAQRRSCCEIVTPCCPDGDLDFARFKSLIDCILPKAPMGSWSWVPRANLHRGHGRALCAHQSGRRICGRRVPVVAGTGGNSTKEAIFLADYAKKWVPIYRCLSCPITTKPPIRHVLAFSRHRGSR